VVPRLTAGVGGAGFDVTRDIEGPKGPTTHTVSSGLFWVSTDGSEAVGFDDSYNDNEDVGGEFALPHAYREGSVIEVASLSPTIK
jgi:hypothetical protein